MDYAPNKSDTFHLNGGFTRSWFQIPAAIQGQDPYDPLLNNTSLEDQRNQIRSFNIAPGWTHLFNANTLLTVNGWFRKDFTNYYPSANPANDQPVTINQSRTLANGGVRADLSYDKGIQNIRIGGKFQHTFLNEAFHVGITDPAFNSPCLTTNAAGDFVPVGNSALTNTSQCAGMGFETNDASNPDAGITVPVFNPTCFPSISLAAADCFLSAATRTSKKQRST